MKKAEKAASYPLRHLPWPVRVAIAWLLALLLAPVLLVIAPIAILTSRPARRTREDVIDKLRAAETGNMTPAAWRSFADKKIADAQLDRVRMQARLVGPPRADRLKLRQLIRELETSP